MVHRLAPQALVDLDNIWNYIDENGSAAAADNIIDAITGRFYLLGQYPRIGRARDDLRAGVRSFLVGQYVILDVIDGEDVEICACPSWPPGHRPSLRLMSGPHSRGRHAARHPQPNC
jgi:toxin ParE1/3/4